MKIVSTNPSKNYETLSEVEITGLQEIKDIVLQAKKSQKLWYEKWLDYRIDTLTKILTLFKEKKEQIAFSISQEMGMPLMQAYDEVEYGYMYFQGYLDTAKKHLSPEVTRDTEKERHTVYYEPKGVVIAIAPWNYPFSMFIWTSIQALLAGNSVIFKTSKEVIVTGQIISHIIQNSWLLSGVWTEVFGDGSIGEFLVEDDINFITFTGSTNVWKRLYKKAADKFIGCVMELGWSAPGIVCEDADIDKVLGTIYFLRYSNCGQMCDGLKRLIVHESRYEEVVKKLWELLLTKKIWIATEKTTDIGPLVSEGQLISLESQVQDALDKGAQILYELQPERHLEGAYHSAMILWNVTDNMRVWHEEVFWPILPVVTFRTLEEAVKLGNDTQYGLWAYVFTESKETLNYLARHLETGEVQHNNFNYCVPESPFGGVKDSGIGREHGHWGFHEFCNVKVVSEEK